MEKLNKEVDFTSLNDNFDEICETVNNGREAVTLSLKSGRKVYIMPEENYDNISHFVIKSVAANALTN